MSSNNSKTQRPQLDGVDTKLISGSLVCFDILGPTGGRGDGSDLTTEVFVIRDERILHRPLEIVFILGPCGKDLFFRDEFEDSGASIDADGKIALAALHAYWARHRASLPVGLEELEIVDEVAS